MPELAWYSFTNVPFALCFVGFRFFLFFLTNLLSQQQQQQCGRCPQPIQ